MFLTVRVGTEYWHPLCLQESTGGRCDPLLARAIPERLGDQSSVQIYGLLEFAIEVRLMSMTLSDLERHFSRLKRFRLPHLRK